MSKSHRQLRLRYLLEFLVLWGSYSQLCNSLCPIFGTFCLGTFAHNIFYLFRFLNGSPDPFISLINSKTKLYVVTNNYVRNLSIQSCKKLEKLQVSHLNNSQIWLMRVESQNIIKVDIFIQDLFIHFGTINSSVINF